MVPAAAAPPPRRRRRPRPGRRSRSLGSAGSFVGAQQRPRCGSRPNMAAAVRKGGIPARTTKEKAEAQQWQLHRRAARQRRAGLMTGGQRRQAERRGAGEQRTRKARPFSGWPFASSRTDGRTEEEGGGREDARRRDLRPSVAYWHAHARACERRVTCSQQAHVLDAAALGSRGKKRKEGEKGETVLLSVCRSGVSRALPHRRCSCAEGERENGGGLWESQCACAPERRLRDAAVRLLFVVRFVAFLPPPPLF